MLSDMNNSIIWMLRRSRTKKESIAPTKVFVVNPESLTLQTKLEEKMKKFLTFLAMGAVVTFVLLFCGTPIHCAIPHMINYQGMLTDDLDDPLSGLLNLTFRIYDDTTGGNLECAEQNSVCPTSESLVWGKGSNHPNSELCIQEGQLTV